MLGLEMNAELDVGPIQKMCGAGFVSDPDFGENLTSLCTPDYTGLRCLTRAREEGGGTKICPPSCFSTVNGKRLIVAPRNFQYLPKK